MYISLGLGKRVGYVQESIAISCEKAGATSATAVTPNMSDTITLFQPGWQILRISSHSSFPVDTILKSRQIKIRKLFPSE